MSATSRTIACALAAGLLLAACSKQPTNEGTANAVPGSAAAMGALQGSLKITSWGPESTKAGEVFNKQPNGSAALWFHVSQSLTAYVAVVEFNGVMLQGIVSGDLVTAGVPPNLYAKPADYKVRVIAHKGGQSIQSNEVQFIVR